MVTAKDQALENQHGSTKDPDAWFRHPEGIPASEPTWKIYHIYIQIHLGVPA
jgi:hypothetical protein